MEILKVDDIASWLRLSKSQVYELTNPRTRNGDLREDPIPVVRMGSAVRFIREDVERWIEKLARK
jgi:excisionase family DNA binding protein